MSLRRPADDDGAVWIPLWKIARIYGMAPITILNICQRQKFDYRSKPAPGRWLYGNPGYPLRCTRGLSETEATKVMAWLDRDPKRAARRHAFIEAQEAVKAAKKAAAVRRRDARKAATAAAEKGDV